MLNKIFSLMALLLWISVSIVRAESLPVLPQFSDIPVTSKIALVHYNPKLKNLGENLKQLKSLIGIALANGANFVVTPELATTGYSITENEVRLGLGIQAPFKELDEVKDLAKKYSAYVVIGIAEIGADGNLYNSAAILCPEGSFKVVRKRGTAGFNKRGDLPLVIINTKYGDVGVVICSDAYLMDIPRVLALQGADIVLSPANWWGDMGQLDIWATRAHENSFYFFVANRWGKESDERYPPNKYDYDMSDAPSAAVSPDGKILFSYKSNAEVTPQNKIFYQEVVIPRSRVGTKLNPTWSLNFRKPALYTEIALTSYRPDAWNAPAPSLPPPGKLAMAAITFSSESSTVKNIEHMKTSFRKCQSRKPEVLVLPSDAFKNGPLNESEESEMKKHLTRFLKDNSLKAIISSYTVKKADCAWVKSLVVTESSSEEVSALHPFPPSSCTESNLNLPFSFDLQGVRIGVSVDRDMVMPEVSMAFAKRGVDVLVASNSLGGINSSFDGYSNDDVIKLLKTMTNNGLHVISSSNKGLGAIFTSENGSVNKLISTELDSCVSADINASAVRSKYLNALIESDLSVLLDNFRLSPGQ